MSKMNHQHTNELLTKLLKTTLTWNIDISWLHNVQWLMKSFGKASQVFPNLQSTWGNIFNTYKLVVPVTFGHPWLRHSSHPEHVVVSTDVVQVSELAVCTLRLSVRVFTPLLDMRKPKTPVLTFWTLVPESFGNFRKHAPLYNCRFFQ
jgi:hypothetical protein